MDFKGRKSLFMRLQEERSRSLSDSKPLFPLIFFISRVVDSENDFVDHRHESINQYFMELFYYL